MEAIKDCTSCYWGDVSFGDDVVVSRCAECDHESSPTNLYPMWVSKKPTVDYDKIIRDELDRCPIHDEPQEDIVNHPKHYTGHPSGVECIQITEHMNFCLGNAMKYIWRAGDKHDNPIEDLKKAAWYIQREIARLEQE